MDPYDLFPGTRPVVNDADAQTEGVKLVLTVEEAALRLGVSRTLMYALVKSGAVESVRIGRLRRIPVDALSEFVRALRSKGSEVA